MKIEYKLFGIKHTHEIEGYEVCVSSYCDDDYYDRQAWDIAYTYWGARFLAWRLARRYAKLEMVDQHMFIYRGLKHTRDDLISWRVLPIKKSVSFWSN